MHAERQLTAASFVVGAKRNIVCGCLLVRRLLVWMYQAAGVQICRWKCVAVSTELFRAQQHGGMKEQK